MNWSDRLFGKLLQGSQVVWNCHFWQTFVIYPIQKSWTLIDVCSDGSVCCLMLMLVRSVSCVCRSNTARWKTCIWHLPRRHRLSTPGLRMRRKIWLTPSAVTRLRKSRSFQQVKSLNVWLLLCNSLESYWFPCEVEVLRAMFLLSWFHCMISHHRHCFLW